MKEKDQLSMGVILHFGINSSDEKMKLIVFGWSTLSNGETREKICRLMIDAINTKLMKRGYCLDHNKEEINS